MTGSDYEQRTRWHAGDATLLSPGGVAVPAKGAAVVHRGRPAVVVDWGGRERVALRPPRGGLEWEAPLVELAAA